MVWVPLLSERTLGDPTPVTSCCHPLYLPCNSESANQPHGTAISPSLLESEQLASLSQLLNLSDDVRHKNSLKGHATPVGDLKASCSLFDEDGEQLLWGIPLG